MSAHMIGVVGGAVLLVLLFKRIETYRETTACARTEHPWEPWSEPEDCGVKQCVPGGEPKEWNGKTQTRLCSKCNILERRWV